MFLRVKKIAAEQHLYLFENAREAAVAFGTSSKALGRREPVEAGSNGASGYDRLLAMPNRLKPTAIRDQLDSLIDEAVRRELAVREAFSLLCERAIARQDERRIEMRTGPARFPSCAISASASPPNPRSTRSGSARSSPGASLPMPRW